MVPRPRPARPGGRRPRGRDDDVGGIAERRGRPPAADLQAPRPARLRAGRRSDPQLPHGLLRAEAARAAARGGEGPCPRRRRRPRDRRAAGRRAPGAAPSPSSRPTRRNGGARGRGRRRGPLRRAVARAGARDHRWRRRRRPRPRRRRAFQRQSARARRGGPRSSSSGSPRVDPAGQGQPAAARNIGVLGAAWAEYVLTPPSSADRRRGDTPDRGGPSAPSSAPGSRSSVAPTPSA